MVDNNLQSRAGFLDRFPALGRLSLKRSPRIPFVQQLSTTECGAACLAMVMAYHGKQVRLEEVRETIGCGRDGVTAAGILEGAHGYGLQGYGIRLDIKDLQYLPRASILHWGFQHFLIFDRLRGGVVDVVDPGSGRRSIPLPQFRRLFTGVALLLEPGEGFTPGTTRQGGLWRHTREVMARSGGFAAILVTSLLLQLFSLAVPLLTGALVDRVVPRADGHLLAMLGVGLLALVGFYFWASLIRGHLFLHLRTRLDALITVRFCAHLVALPYSFFQRCSAGDLMMRLNSNATVREILTSGTLSGVIDGTLVSLYLLVLFYTNATMATLVLFLGLLQLGVFLLSRRRQEELLSNDLEAQSRAQSYQVEMFSGIETLKAMGQEERAVEHWSELFVAVLNATLCRGQLGAWVDALTGALRLGSPLFVLGYGAAQVLAGEMSLGTMLAMAALAGGVLLPLSALVTTAGQFQLLRSYTRRIDDVLDTPVEQDRTAVRKSGVLGGQIALERVSFRYGPQAPLVVRDVSLTIATGQFVAIVGRSGSGKSTLANLLLGLHLPTEGRVLYDGTDLTELDLCSVRRQLGIVNQQPALFGTSLRQNIAIAAPDSPLDAVMSAAQRACIHHEIMAMPMKYETRLTDRGASLSGGQRQRVALARALLHGPAILLLDEATSALDAVTEKAVQEELSRLQCTRIVIAHRLSTIVQADLILVMDEGRLVEQGTHEQLLQRGERYAQLIAAQVAG